MHFPAVPFQNSPIVHHAEKTRNQTVAGTPDQGKIQAAAA
jgi:hypothetical protein